MGWTLAGQTEPVKTVTRPDGTIGNRTYTAHWRENSADVAYLDYDPDTGEFSDATVPGGDYTLVMNRTNSWGDSGKTTWYVVDESVTITSRITVTGDVNLVLCDNCALTAPAGIDGTGSGADGAGIIADTREAVANGRFDDTTARFVRDDAWSGTAYRYTWTVSGVANDQTVYVRAYLVYTDGAGALHTVYGDVVQNTYHSNS